MTEIILHHYPLSPYAEKIRTEDGTCGVVAVHFPRVGYRVTPQPQPGPRDSPEDIAKAVVLPAFHESSYANEAELFVYGGMAQGRHCAEPATGL